VLITICNLFNLVESLSWHRDFSPLRVFYVYSLVFALLHFLSYKLSVDKFPLYSGDDNKVDGGDGGDDVCGDL